MFAVFHNGTEVCLFSYVSLMILIYISEIKTSDNIAIEINLNKNVSFVKQLYILVLKEDFKNTYMWDI